MWRLKVGGVVVIATLSRCSLLLLFIRFPAEEKRSNEAALPFCNFISAWGIFPHLTLTPFTQTLALTSSRLYVGVCLSNAVELHTKNQKVMIFNLGYSKWFFPPLHDVHLKLEELQKGEFDSLLTLHVSAATPKTGGVKINNIKPLLLERYQRCVLIRVFTFKWLDLSA